jgi:hypothetical protein
MTSSAVLDAEHGSAATAVPARLLVTWQEPQSRQYHPMGFLDCHEGGYEFAYLSRTVDDCLLPLLGFSDTARRYRSTSLFPLFAQRLMSHNRPDRLAYLAAIGLSDGSQPMQILARSGGRRFGDTIELLAPPLVEADGRTSAEFFVHGVRHTEGAAEYVAQLSPGTELKLSAEPSNPVNNLAILVEAESGQRLGWVPDPLLDYVHRVRAQSAPATTILHVNDGAFGPNMRLLIRLEGQVRSGYQPFGGPLWKTVA